MIECRCGNGDYDIYGATSGCRKCPKHSQDDNSPKSMPVLPMTSPMPDDDLGAQTDYNQTDDTDGSAEHTPLSSNNHYCGGSNNKISIYHTSGKLN